MYSTVNRLLHQISGLVIILTGALVILITVLGCCGISRESERMITVYWILLGLMVLVQCIIGVTAYFYKDQVSYLPTSITISVNYIRETSVKSIHFVYNKALMDY